jgi:apolipoprotein D and lipocalin family protein
MRHRTPPFHVRPTLAALLLAAHAATPAAPAAEPPPLRSLPELAIGPYMGTWYQVAYFPNVFQRQCVSDTTATYAQQPDGRIEVRNRCRTADGRVDEAVGAARVMGTVDNGVLKPAQLRVSFLPAWLRWLTVAEGDYWVIQRADDGRYAVVSAPSRRYLWVLARTPRLAPEDETAIRSRLQAQGFDLSAWTAHPHGTAAAGTAPR